MNSSAKMFLAAALIIGGGLAFAGIARADNPTTAPTSQPSADAKAVNVKCAVEGEDDVDPAVFTMYKGQKIGFCCKSCVKKFEADPEKYIATMK